MWKVSPSGGLIDPGCVEWSNKHWRWLHCGHTTYLTNRKAIVTPATSRLHPGLTPCYMSLLIFWHSLKHSLKTWMPPCLRVALSQYLVIIFPVPCSASTQKHHANARPWLLLLAHNRCKPSFGDLSAEQMDICCTKVQNIKREKNKGEHQV